MAVLQYKHTLRATFTLRIFTFLSSLFVYLMQASTDLAFISPSILSGSTKDLLFLHCVLCLGTWCVIARVGGNPSTPERTLNSLRTFLADKMAQYCLMPPQIWPHS